ncbi:MAG: putative Dihydroorotate dehydrogenase (quinone) [Parcubacteria group bacterium Licking1014_17]|nr:MAG: putative Dihydroorotate dehydrogenase (quinone) [Parcubacteria group bacterium Licking1014_17]
MGFLYKYILRPVLFRFKPEKMHNFFIHFGAFLGSNMTTKGLVGLFFHYQNPALEQEIAGIKFKNPVGLAAGFDKDANITNIAEDVGFGFMSVGTATNKPYAGNPSHRLWRLPKSKALVVDYGLKNIGIDKIAEKLKKRGDPDFPIFVSVGKTNSPGTVSDEAGIDDYCQCLKKVIEEGIGDAYEINISCPNAFGGESFAEPEKLDKLLAKIFSLPVGKPLFLKMPITLPFSEFKKLLDVAMRYRVTGVIIGNLEKNYASPLLKEKIPDGIKGGISGKPCFNISNELISETKKYCGEKLIIIGVGGIFSAEDAYEKIKRGASLVQLITGMIYEGPQLIGEINRGLVELLEKDGYKNIKKAISSFHKF